MAVLPPISLWQFFGFAPSPQPSIWQNIFMDVFIALGIPMSLMMSLSDHGPGTFMFELLSLANSVVWGLCIGFPIYKIRRRYFSHAA
jgi:hypothetical protein